MANDASDSTPAYSRVDFYRDFLIQARTQELVLLGVPEDIRRSWLANLALCPDADVEAMMALDPFWASIPPEAGRYAVTGRIVVTAQGVPTVSLVLLPRKEEQR